MPADLLERAFNQLANKAEVDAEERERKRRKREAKAVSQALDEPVLQPAEEAIKAILKADQNKDYFECAPAQAVLALLQLSAPAADLQDRARLRTHRSPKSNPAPARRLLQLPPPSMDALGRPVCPCSAADISKAYRRLSVRVHPDKNPGEDARLAFEALNKAHRLLKQPGPLVRCRTVLLLPRRACVTHLHRLALCAHEKAWLPGCCPLPAAAQEADPAAPVQEEALKHSLQEARRRQDAAEAAATPGERVVLYAAKKDQAKQLHRQQARRYTVGSLPISVVHACNCVVARG